MQRIRRSDAASYSDVEWLKPEQVGKTYIKLLPACRDKIPASEVRELAAIFGKRRVGGKAVEAKQHL